MQYKTLANCYFPTHRWSLYEVMKIDVYKLSQGFQRTHARERHILIFISILSYWLSWTIRRELFSFFFWMFDKHKTKNKHKTKKAIAIKIFFHGNNANKWSCTFIYFTGIPVSWECRRKINKSVLFWDTYITFRQCRRTPLLIFSGIMIFSWIVVQFDNIDDSYWYYETVLREVANEHAPSR